MSASRAIPGAVRCGAVIGMMGVFGGCEDRALPPAGQLVIYVDTDAPIGPTNRGEGLLDTPGLFDRLRIEVLAPDGSLACAECLRDFVVTSEELDLGKLSVGVKLPEARADYRARVRFYVEERRVNEEPGFDTSIDGLFALPAHGSEGITEVTAFVPFASLGERVDLTAPAQAMTPGRVLRGERVVPSKRPQCASAARPGEVCVPGGAFWAKRTDSFLLDTDTWHAIVMSPFFLDEREVTVGDVRAAKVETASDPSRNTNDDPATCTYTSAPGAFESLPVTCVGDVAAAYCKKKGATLPTGAQLEYVRGKLSSQAYVWGLDPPTCFDAVWGRGKADLFNDCVSLGAGPQSAGRGARDRLVLPTGNILDVAGNVAELLSDWPPACAQTGVLFDPVCGSSKSRSTAGSFAQDRAFLQSPARYILVATGPAIGNIVSPFVGFRCARADGE